MTHQNDAIAGTCPVDPIAVFGDLAALVYASGDFSDVCQAICSSAPRLVSGCDHASLLTKQGGNFVTAAASDDVARQIDAFERELRTGPCVDAIEEEAAQFDTDLAAGSKWPELSVRVLEQTPVRGMMGFRLLINDRKAGALNLFSDTAGAMTPASHNEAAILASFASVALIAQAAHEGAEALRAGLLSNREIGKAVGLMMAFHQVSDEEAFGLLRSASQSMNLKLAQIAREVVDHENDRPEQT